MNIQIDPEFRALIPPLSTQERAQLEANLLHDGCRDPLVVWNDTLLDGHNRHEICTAHGLAFNTFEIDLPDRDAAADWIDTNQLGRRNLTPDQASLLRGRRYNRAKERERHEPSGQFVRKEVTAERLAEQHGVTERTIRRDGDFAEAVEQLKPHVPDIEQRVMSGDVPSKQAVVEAAREPEKATEILAKPHVANNSGNNEWYTPEPLIAAARDAMGEIDVDPASSPVANRIVNAKTFFTAEINGLSRPWDVLGWLHPEACACEAHLQPVYESNEDLSALSEQLSAHARILLAQGGNALFRLVVQRLREAVGGAEATHATSYADRANGEIAALPQRKGATRETGQSASGQSQAATTVFGGAFRLDSADVGAGQAGVGLPLRVLWLARDFNSGSFHSFVASYLSWNGSMEHGASMLVLQYEQGAEGARELVQGQIARCPDCRVAGFAVRTPTNVFLNPPYATPLIGRFAEAVSDKYDAKEIKRACVLVNNATETSWFQRMLESAAAVCFVRARVRFLDPEGRPSGAPLQGQAVLYLGENPVRFARSFGELGQVLVKP